MEINNTCCCCLLRPPNKNLKIPYTRNGRKEIYANMFKECFEIQLTSLSNNDVCGICEACVSRLRDASDFKQQVQRSQAELLARRQGSLLVKEEDAVKPEISDNTGQEEIIYFSEVKTETLVDPLPIARDEEFKEFMLGLENQSDVCKQEPYFEVPINERSAEFPYKKESSVIEGTFVYEFNSETHAFVTNTYTCNICGEQFSRKTEQRAHKRIHKKSKYACEVCKKQFKLKSRLNDHTRVHTGEKPYGCDICNKRFSDRSNVRMHKRIHGDQKYTCDICKAQFKRKSNLTSHMGTHTGQKRFRCKYCLVKFLDSTRLRRHIRKNHEGGYSCDQCKQVFHDRSQLGRHLNVHTKMIVYPCDLCDMKLSTMSSLRRHQLIHTQERPYPCEFCNKQFRYKHGLHAHILTHTGEKPYCCEICGKQFAQTNNLKKHLEIHVEGKTYACELCSKSYSTSEGLRQHRRTHTKNKAPKSVGKRQKCKE